MTDSEKWLVLAGVLTVGVLLYLLAPALTPFLFSALLAYLGDPLVDRLDRAGASRTLGVVIVFTVMVIAGIGGLLILIPALERQITVIIAKTPQAIDWIQNWLPRLSERFGIPLAIDADTLKQSLMAHWKELGDVIRQLVVHIGRSSQMLLGWLT
ncbi:MAG: AI-2E family transporter, partial [Gammaproteobacteria bacterium]